MILNGDDLFEDVADMLPNVFDSQEERRDINIDVDYAKDIFETLARLPANSIPEDDFKIMVDNEFEEIKTETPVLIIIPKGKIHFLKIFSFMQYTILLDVPDETIYV